MDKGFVGNDHLDVVGPGGGEAQQDKDDHPHARVQHLVVVWHEEIFKRIKTTWKHG